MAKTEIAAYRLEKADLETYLKKLFGQREFRIQVNGYHGRRELCLTVLQNRNDAWVFDIPRNLKPVTTLPTLLCNPTNKAIV